LNRVQFHFDLDGTLLNTVDLHIESYRAAFKAMEIEWVDDLELCIRQGGKVSGIINAINSKNVEDFIPTLLLAKNNYFRSNLSKVTPNESVIRLLGIFPQQNHLVTSAKHETVGLLLASFNLQKDFKFIVSHESTSFNKPHPEPYLLSMNNSKESLFHIAIEDSAAGVESAQKAGMYVILACEIKDFISNFQ
jgi:HAD superfamily hydrolase (TIGR01509 family)